jgi:hypothetical protein
MGFLCMLKCDMLSRKRVVAQFGSVSAVAKFFGIARAAVYQWDEDGKGIPRERELELMLRLPHVFGAPVPIRKKERCA